MSWFEYFDSGRELYQIQPRVVLCAPHEDHLFWKARLESLGIDQIYLLNSHRDGLDMLHSFYEGGDWESTIMLSDRRVGWESELTDNGREILGPGGYCGPVWTAVEEIGDQSSEKVTYKSSDQKLVEFLSEALDCIVCCTYSCHGYKPIRHVRRGNL